MFVFLSKKIAIPNGVKLRTVAWNNDQGWIACGGEDGLLKVLKLENQAGPTPAAGGPADAAAGGTRRTGDGNVAPSNLSMNQTLEGHTGAVVVSKWNEQYRKLTTSDQYGLIIVWILYKGIWYEEMINNRNKSVVADMQWSKDGQKICIAYEDGAVIVGSVDGNRLWGKELKQTQLAHVQWSPDGKTLLFGIANGEIHLFDNTGTFLSKLAIFCNDNATSIKIAGIDWYNGNNGYLEQRVPCLAIAMENGKIQIMKDEKDTAPCIIDTNMRYIKIKWNNNGTILAVSGVQFARSSQGEEKEISVVQFYDPFGQYLRSLKVPGKKISSISWEHSGLRIALAVDSFIYFANIRPDYKWTFFAEDILVYGFNRYDRPETTLIFWNTKTNEKYIKLINKLCLITSYGEHCLLVAKADESGSQYTLTVSNAIGTAIESKHIDFVPKIAILTKNHVIAASSDIVFVWQFKVLSKKNNALDAIRRKDVLREKFFHIDEVPDISTSETAASIIDLKKKRPSSDPILSLAASDSMLILARQTGSLIQLALPSVTLETKYMVPLRPQYISLNSNSTRLSIIDGSGVLKLFDLGKKGGSSTYSGTSPSSNIAMANPAESGKILDFERKDVWDIKWASDNPESFAIMEKTRLYIFKNIDPEEPITCPGYICAFENLQVRAALLDDVFREPEAPAKDCILQIDSKVLKDTRNILTQVGLAEGMQYVEDNSHPRLWKLVADTALEKLDFNVAQKAFVRCVDYKGLQFLKKLQKLDDPQKQRAEISAHFGHFDVAERIYLEIDRKDLAIDLRIQLGDWFRVVQLIKSGGSGDDVMLDKAWNAIGDYYFDRQRWLQSITYYQQARNIEKLIECYYIVEDYDNLEKIIYTLPENNKLLLNIANKFVTVGLCDQAVSAFIKVGEIKSAIDTCVNLNKWNTAVELAETHRFREIESLLAKYASYLLEQQKRLSAIELYRKANYCQKSARLLYDLAEEAAKQNKQPLKIKKFFVLAALEVERYHQITKSKKGPYDSETSALEGLLAEDRTDIMDNKFLDNVWRGAEAYHFYILAQRQFYSGNMSGSMKTCLHLRNYEDIIDPKIIYSLLALSAFNCNYYSICSSAFIHLESLPNITPEEREIFENLALSIFTKFAPANPPPLEITCTNCAYTIRDCDTFCSSCHFTFPTCVVSGRPIYESIHFMCHVCKHRAIESEIAGMNCCALCHSTL